MTPNLEEAVKRLEGVTWPSDRSGDLEMVFAELRRLSAPAVCVSCGGSGNMVLEGSISEMIGPCTECSGKRSAPVAGTYEEACKAACECCAKGASKTTVHTHFNPLPMDMWRTATLPCTAPTELEWGEQLARRVFLAESQLDTAVNTYIDNHARLEQEIDELRLDRGRILILNATQGNEVARLRGVLEQYANRKNWGTGDDQSRVERLWFGDENYLHGYELAERTLAQPEEGKEADNI